MPKKHKAKLKSKKLVIYLHDKTRPGYEEGTVHLCDEYGHLQKNNEEHFNLLDDVGVKIKNLLAANNVKWP
jgi:hypothetical protein